MKLLKKNRPLRNFQKNINTLRKVSSIKALGMSHQMIILEKSLFPSLSSKLIIKCWIWLLWINKIAKAYIGNQKLLRTFKDQALLVLQHLSTFMLSSMPPKSHKIKRACTLKGFQGEEKTRCFIK